MTDPWVPYYTAVAQFAGTLFAIAAATRIVLPYKSPKGLVWVFEGLGYLVELAIATIICLVFISPVNADLRGVILFWVPLVGLAFLVSYGITVVVDTSRGLMKPLKHTWLHYLQAAFNVLPFIAYWTIFVPQSWLQDPRNPDQIAGAITWLVISGSIQICLVFALRETTGQSNKKKKKKKRPGIQQVIEVPPTKIVLTIWDGWSITKEVKHKQDNSA